MIAFVIGLVISALVILVLIVPALNEDKDAKIKELQTAVENYSGETNMTPEEVLEMRTELQKLQKESLYGWKTQMKHTSLQLIINTTVFL